MRTIDFSQNCLKNGGAAEISRLLKRKNSISKVVLNKIAMKEQGLVALLAALKMNKKVTKLVAEDNKFGVSRGILALIGNLVAYQNNTLQFL